MTTLSEAGDAGPCPANLRDRAAAEAYVASVCFKHGPPRLVGVELEWTVHHADDPARPLDAETLTRALGHHAPPSLAPDSRHLPLAHGSLVTVEPGGQVEISTPPHSSLTELLAATSADIAALTELLAAHGLVMGIRGCDPYRPPRRLLRIPRYDAMESAFQRIGPDGIAMMCSTAGLQVCLDVGERARLADRWAALHALGPVLIALFANSAEQYGNGTAWASARTRVLLGTDPPRTLPSEVTDDPAGSWARRVLDTPLVCVRRPGGCWNAPPGVTFADWIAGALPRPPTTDDLDYHVSTMFTPVRPRGYLEVRYLDAQPPGEWVAPVVLLVSLLGSVHAVGRVREVTEPVLGRWLEAARLGLTDPCLARAARDVVDLGCGVLDGTDLPGDLRAVVAEALQRRLAGDGRHPPSRPAPPGTPPRRLSERR
ncbi:glutamate--cysteine ligase EgtA [Gandjariella thermophila]|uniref:Glutamate--cysteine ligase EgtA n=1 Tax=Gandjariella thermophila TaxID=1931992 RepID=A0A4D4IWA7_9PSEU|nr:ergothioneine biosynthesis glutamate--cysteine ligase EgtA [Gandjariella thermophila]GDY28635.1 glutamate--cysteine ligase EgtA [Gandjariella thermophila]